MKTDFWSRRGFTLVETVMALGIAMLFLAAIFMLLSVGLTTSQDASNDTTVGLILRETASRMRGVAFSASPSTSHNFYFDNRGRFVDQTTADVRNNEYLAVATVATLATPPSHANLRAVVVKVYSRVGQTANAPVPPGTPKATFTLLKTSASGRGWQSLDPSYQPKIDL